MTSSKTPLPQDTASKRQHAWQLHACYFLLGMGLLAPATCIWQCLDYMKARYPEAHPSRVLALAYNTLYAIILIVLFFGGTQAGRNRRHRLLGGFSVYVFALAAPPLVDMLVWSAGASPPPAAHVAFTAWVFGAALAGAADAAISSVVYGNAAALGQSYTHVFMAGKASCGLTMAVLRCVGKAALPGDNISTKGFGTAIFVGTAAVLVAVCVYVVARRLPRLQPEQETQVAPAVLSVQHTLMASHAVSSGAVPPKSAGLLPLRDSLASMQSCMGGAAVQPMWSISREPASDTLHHQRLSVQPLDHQVATLGQESSRLLPTMSTQRHKPVRGWGSVPANQEPVQTGDNSNDAPPGERDVMPKLKSFPAQHSTARLSGKRSMPHAPGRTDPHQAGSGEDSSLGSSQQSFGKGRAMPSEGSVSGSDSSHTEDSHQVLSPHGHHEPPALPPVLEESALVGSRSNDLSPFAAADLDDQLVVVTSGADSKSLHQHSPADSMASQSDSKATAAKLKSKDFSLPGHQSYFNSPFFTAGRGTTDSASLTPDDEPEDPVQPGIRVALQALWVTSRSIYAFQLAVFLPPLITASILPIVFNMDFSQSVLGQWYVQVAALAYQTGGLVGSALIPIYSPKHPRATLIGAAVFMTSFVAIFAILLKAAVGPVIFITMVFIMFVYNGYLSSCVFCLASQGLLADDAQMVQMVLVLTTAVSLVLGGFTSWAWLAMPQQAGARI